MSCGNAMYESYHWHHKQGEANIAGPPLSSSLYYSTTSCVWNEAASYQQAFLENEPTFTHHTFLKCSFGILQIVFVRK